MKLATKMLLTTLVIYAVMGLAAEGPVFVGLGSGGYGYPGGGCVIFNPF